VPLWISSVENLSATQFQPQLPRGWAETSAMPVASIASSGHPDNRSILSRWGMSRLSPLTQYFCFVSRPANFLEAVVTKDSPNRCWPPKAARNLRDAKQRLHRCLTMYRQWFSNLKKNSWRRKAVVELSIDEFKASNPVKLSFILNANRLKHVTAPLGSPSTLSWSSR
jgi:hypothetical protein